MKFVKITLPEENLMIPSDCYDRSGINLLAQVFTKKNAVILCLPSLKNELKWRFNFQIFVFDVERNAGLNNITIKTEGGERINGESEITIATNGGCVAIQPIGDNDWFCFVPATPAKVKADALAEPVAVELVEEPGLKSAKSNGAEKNLGGRPPKMTAPKQ